MNVIRTNSSSSFPAVVLAAWKDTGTLKILCNQRIVKLGQFGQPRYNIYNWVWCWQSVQLLSNSPNTGSHHSGVTKQKKSCLSVSFRPCIQKQPSIVESKGFGISLSIL
jgi:hypothetical protein